MFSSCAFTCSSGTVARRSLNVSRPKRLGSLSNSFLSPRHFNVYTRFRLEYSFCYSKVSEAKQQFYGNSDPTFVTERRPNLHEKVRPSNTWTALPSTADALLLQFLPSFSSSGNGELKEVPWSTVRESCIVSDYSLIKLSSIYQRYARQIADTHVNHGSSSSYRVTNHCGQYGRQLNQNYILNRSKVFSTSRRLSTKFTGSDPEKKDKNMPSPGVGDASGFSSIASSANSIKSTSSTKSLAEEGGSSLFFNLLSKGIEVSSWMIRTSFNLLIKSPSVLFYYLTRPKELSAKISEFKEHAKKEANHYWMGMKLLAADVRTARRLLVRTLNGSALTRRERKQLLRTTSDLFRLVPMSMFIIIPFMEFALPFALKLFPNILPSTFQDSLKAEENMKRELQSRIAMAGFFQETLQDLAKAKGKQALKLAEKPADADSTAAEFLGFLEKARTGEFVSPEVIIRFSKYFQDELTLDNLPRTQLVNLCKYMSIPSYGSDPFLRFQLRHHIRSLKEDDQRILWEGIDSLTKIELSEACRERGMRSTGLSKEQYKIALQQWLDLSVNQNVPISLLIMSRSFFLFEPKSKQGQRGSVSGISDAISAMDKDILNQVVLEVATPEERSHNTEVVKISLEVLEHENEKIKVEFEERQATKRKEEEKKKVDGEKKRMENEQKKEETQPLDEVKLVEEKIKKADVAETLPLNTDVKVVPDMKSIKPEVDVAAVPKKKTDRESTADDKEFEKEKEQTVSLSAEELNAIAQLISLSAVDTERAELERIKTAMMIPESKETFVDYETAVEKQETATNVPEWAPPAEMRDEKVLPDEKFDSKVSIDSLKAEIVSGTAAEAATGADLLRGTPVNVDSQLSEQEEKEHEKTGGTKLDATMAQLKSKLEKMVGKIELQLSDVEMKIGNRMHFLDKDLDGLLTNEEVAQCLQLVLRRELTFDEAMAIANDMDTDRDGMFTVFELNKWIETNKIVKLAEQGRDAEVDKAIANAREKLHKNKMQPKESST